MPCRRPHRKSRLGCKTCKIRRTKCDERRPGCSNCQKHGVVCDFERSSSAPTSMTMPPVMIPPLQKRASQEAAPIEHHSASGWSTCTESQKESPTSSNYSRATRNTSSPKTCSLVLSRMDSPSERLLELRLLHHYMTMTTPTFQARQMGDILISSSGGNVYANWMMRLAFETPSVMDALLGFSAFHLCHINKFDKEASYASLKFMTRAISQHAKNIRSGITRENAEICFATSTLIAFHSARTYFLTRAEELNAAPVLPLHWFNHWKGVRVVLAEGWNHIKTEDIKSILLAESTSMKSLLLSSSAPSPHPFSFLVEDLDRETTDQETQFAYDSAVAWLAKAQAHLVMRNVFKFTAVVTSRFIQLLEEKDPRTLCICAYFFVLMKKLDTIWWLDGAAAPEFWNLMTFIPEEWKPLMAWGVSQIEEGTRPAQTWTLGLQSPAAV